MNLETIKNQLEMNGYHTKYSHGSLIVGEKTGDDHEKGGYIFLGFEGFCMLSLSDNKIIIEHSPASISYIEEFTTVSKAISFIKKTFPL